MSYNSDPGHRYKLRVIEVNRYNITFNVLTFNKIRSRVPAGPFPLTAVRETL